MKQSILFITVMCSILCSFAVEQKETQKISSTLQGVVNNGQFSIVSITSDEWGGDRNTNIQASVTYGNTFPNLQPYSERLVEGWIPYTVPYPTIVIPSIDKRQHTHWETGHAVVHDEHLGPLDVLGNIVGWIITTVEEVGEATFQHVQKLFADPRHKAIKFTATDDYEDFIHWDGEPYDPEEQQQRGDQYEESYWIEDWETVFYDTLRTNYSGLFTGAKIANEDTEDPQALLNVLRDAAPSGNFCPTGLSHSQYTHEFVYVAGTGEISNTWTLYYSTNLNGSWYSNMSFTIGPEGVAYCATQLPSNANPVFVVAKRSGNYSEIYGFYDRSFSGTSTNLVAHPFATDGDSLYEVYPSLTNSDSIYLLTGGSEVVLTMTNLLWNGQFDPYYNCARLGKGTRIRRNDSSGFTAYYSGVVPRAVTNYIGSYRASLIGSPFAVGGSFTNALRGFTPSEWSHVEPWNGYGWGTSVYYYSGSWHGDFTVPVSGAFSFYNAGAAKAYCVTNTITLP